MARRQSEELNTLRLFDNISGSSIELYYRLPTTEERNSYANFAVQRKGRKQKLDFRVPEAQIKYGAKILEGIREGDFEIPLNSHPNMGNLDRNEKYVTISSDQSSPFFHEKWKDVVLQVGADLVQALGRHVFEASAEEEDDQD